MTANTRKVQKHLCSSTMRQLQNVINRVLNSSLAMHIALLTSDVRPNRLSQERYTLRTFHQESGIRKTSRI